MLASNVLVLTKILYHVIEDVIADSNICVWRNFIVDGLVCHGYQPVLMPKGASTQLPSEATGIAELMATA